MNISVNIGQILIKIWDATAGELKHLRRPKPRIEEFRKARETLKATTDDIDMRIIEAPRIGEIPTNEIQDWQKKVKDFEGKADETEQDFERRRCLGAWSWNCFSVNRRVAKRMDRIRELLERSRTVQVTTKKPPPFVVEFPISKLPLAFEPYMSKILGYIASPNATEVIGVYGMGGVGKTTLLKSINNHREHVDRFDHVIWAVASNECKIEKLQKDIAKRLQLPVEEDDSQQDLAAKLSEFLKNKDCLLLLDDLWNPLDLELLGMVSVPSGQGEQQKRKVVVFTTRDVQVCGRMKANREMKIECLQPNDAWELFQSKASNAIGSDRGIQHIARQIARECAGLPLALITVGVAMSGKKSWEEWKNALTFMKDSKMPKITGNNEADPMFSAFKLSYKSLEDDETRGCLLSCALWPEDHLIDKEQLIQCWMGLGLIDEAAAIHNAYNRGHSHIETLKAACLLEPGDDEESEVKMHDVIRDMALWLGKEKFKWIVRAGVAASQVSEEERWHEAERVSLMYNDIASLPNQLPTCSKLSVLMLQCNYELTEIRGSFIQAMCFLTYLDLQNTKIAEIPKEIRMLSQLRHLNLSRTWIHELPVELGCLTKLNYLFLRYMIQFTTVAEGAISNLSSLKFLDLTGSRYEENNWLDEVEGQKCSIGIQITKADTFERLCSLRRVLIWRLKVVWVNENNSANPNQLLDDIIKRCNTRQSMEQLIIDHVESKELLISEGSEEAGGLECLKYLELQVLEQLEEITWKGVLPQIVFPNLRELHIVHCYKLRNINWVLQLPSLSVLFIEHCSQMVELISDEGSSSPSPFGLRKMSLVYMEKLERISCRPLYFPNIEKIEVEDCLLLRKLPFDKANILKVIRCQQKWWNNLEWEDESIKNSLSPLVTVGKEVLPLAAVEHIPTPYSTVGIEECMSIILRHIDSANATEVIGVYGMAGVGKTTLLRRINNHINVAKFDHVIWAVASRECKIERLQMDIANKSGFGLPEDDTERDRASKLFDKLENEDCLLLLDDLREHLDLTMLGMARAMQGRQKQKRKVVVFTTRNEQVWSNMNAGTKVEIKCLEPDKAWELFRRNTNEDAIRSEEIESIARQIAQECAGLPLALITVGRAMSKKKSREAWSNALTMMKKEADPMLPAFKLSFDSLEDDNMRGRLLSCTLWPEYLSIDKDKLIECWMVLGLIDGVGAIPYNEGHSHIKTLKAACLLEPGDDDEESEVKMHDVIRDMALRIASDCGKEKCKWIVRAGAEASQVVEGEGWPEAERVLLMYNDIASLPNQLPTSSKISVLMLQCNHELKEIGGTLIQAMCSLTYLDLENTGITEIPKEIGMLSQLRHLNLSRTYIRELPVELGCLTKLNYLFLRLVWNLTTVAEGAISNLSSLKFLDLRGSGYERKHWLDEVEGQKCSIGIDIWTAAALQRLCSLPRVLIWRLKVEILDDSANPNQLLDDIIKSCNTRQSMQQLIIHVKSKELLISEGNEEAGGLECLKFLQLDWLEKLEEITWKGVLPQTVFPNLRELNIVRCYKLRNINWVLQLPSLSVLSIAHCYQMVELISDEGSSSPSPFGLTKMRLVAMEKLERISCRPLYFPNLEKIEVLYCPLVIKLPFDKVNRLEVILCEQTWWNNLEWEDESIKNSLSPLVNLHIPKW